MLTFDGAMLVGEMVPVTREYMRNNPMCAERQQFDHVIVDEFQDLNRAEQMLVDLLAEQGSLSVIGDEDQSIYSFKHAHPEGVTTFADGHPGTHDEWRRACEMAAVLDGSCTISGAARFARPAGHVVSEHTALALAAIRPRQSSGATTS